MSIGATSNHSSPCRSASNTLQDVLDRPLEQTCPHLMRGDDETDMRYEAFRRNWHYESLETRAARTTTSEQSKPVNYHITVDTRPSPSTIHNTESRDTIVGSDNRSSQSRLDRRKREEARGEAKTRKHQASRVVCQPRRKRRHCRGGNISLS